MTIEQAEHQLTILHQELERGCFDYLDHLQDSDPFNWWSMVKNPYGIYVSPQIATLHRKIIYQLIRHRKFDALDSGLESTQFYFHYTHWTLILLETLHARKPSLDPLKAIASRHLKLHTTPILSSQQNIITRLLRVLVLDCEPRDIIVFFDHCKTIHIGDDYRAYNIFRSHLLRNVKLWNECQSRSPSSDLIASFYQKWSQADEAIKYVRKMFKEEQATEVTFNDVFHELSISVEQRRLEARAEYVVAELVLAQTLSSDILKYVLQSYVVIN